MGSRLRRLALGLRVINQEDVVGLQISVNDAAGVHRLQALGDLQRDPAGSHRIQASAAQHLGQRRALQELHDQIRASIGQHSEVADVYGVGMPDCRSHFGFLQKAALRGAVLGF